MDVEELLIINQINLDLVETKKQALEIPWMKTVVKQTAFDMLDAQFVKNVRLTKQLTRVLIELICSFMNPPSGASALSIETKVLVALHFYGHGTYQEGIGKRSIAGVSQIISTILSSIAFSIKFEDSAPPGSTGSFFS